MMLSSIKSNSIFQYFSNLITDIPNTQDIPLFRLTVCVVVLNCCATHVVAMFIAFFLLSNMCRDSFINLSV